MEVVKSTLEQQVENVAAVEEQEKQRSEFVKARIEFAKRQLTGKLTLAEFKTLNPGERYAYLANFKLTLNFKQYQALTDAERRLYTRRYGRPKSDDQIRGQKNRVAKRHRRNKIASKSRAANRG